MKEALGKLEEFLGIGGAKKDITFLILGGISLILSLAKVPILPFDMAWIAVILCGIPIILEAIVGLVTEFDIKADVLVSLALVASIIIGQIFAAGEVAFIMQIGAFLEDMTVAKARAGIEKLVNLTPQVARVIVGKNENEAIIPAERVAINDLIRVLPGETIPVDGIIVSGQTSINQAVMTGESLPVDKQEGDELLKYAASAEKLSEHPLGKAVVRYFGDDTYQEVTNFDMTPGKGITANVDGHSVLAGNTVLLAAHGVEIPDDVIESAKKHQGEGATAIYIAVDNKMAGLIVLADTLREESQSMIQKILKIGIKPVLLTGDEANAAKYIAMKLGITELKSSCLPEDKLNYIENSQNEQIPICMIGDGINDAPALKKSNVGIAMGGVGSDIAVDAADIALVDDKVEELPHLLALARRMMVTIKINLSFSMTLNFVAIILAILGILNPVIGALVHNAGSVMVIINSALLLKWHTR